MDIFDPKELALLQVDPDENASLENLLTKRNLPLLELLSIKNIQSKIRSNFNFFIKYCQKNEDFCFNLIDIGIKCPMHQGANDNMKQACYIAADVLTCDQDVVAELLILPDKSKAKRKYSGNESDQFQEIQQSIETQANDLSKPEQADPQDESLTDQQRFNKKFKYLSRLLDYIGTSQTKNLDQNCINYMIKALNCLVRKKTEQFLDFLDKKPQVFKRLIELNNYNSISQFLIKILSDDENQGERIEKVKNEIIKEVWKKIMDSVSQEDFVQRLDFLEELFQTNKYASEDDRTQLQKMSDTFASQQTIQFFNQYLIKPKTPTQFSNAVSYMICILKRMNIDEEVDPYSYTNEPKQETMVFRVDVLYKDFINILTKGYENLSSLKYPEPYKQKMVETKFYEFLVLLTKNSRFTNCSETKAKCQSSILTGYNIILSTRQAKITALKQILKQFTNQSKNGINRIYLISLIEKVLNMQVYEPQNHINQNDEKTGAKNENQSKSKAQGSQTKNLSSQTNSPQKQQRSNNQDDDPLDEEDKKSKINKIKAGLKLNIKKFTLQTNESPQKQQQKKEPQPNNTQDIDHVKKHESTLTKDEVLDILKYFSQIINKRSETIVSEEKKKQKNHETQIGALINKVLMIFSNIVEWPQSTQESLIVEKQSFINQIQTIFNYFNFVEICKNYSVTLATNKHPNVSAKEKTNPELTFTNQFFKIYQTKKQQSPENLKEKNQKNLEFSDSDFKSDEEEIVAVKCSIQDFKKFTGFTMENKFPAKEQPQSFIAAEQIQTQKTQKKIQTPQKQEPQVEQKQQQKEDGDKKQSPPQKQTIRQQNQQQKAKKDQKKENKKGSEAKTAKEEVIKQKKIPFEFYIKHQAILV